jgi:hypothetical protein
MGYDYPPMHYVQPSYGGYGTMPPAYPDFYQHQQPLHHPPPPPPPMQYGGYGVMPTGGGMGAPRERGSDHVLTGEETKLFVGGLPYQCGDPDLRAIFATYGTIKDLHLMHPSSQTQQRCAFVTFDNHASALAATKLGGVYKITPTDKPIVVRFADQQANKRPRC